MNILLLFIPLFWTGVPIPVPECVEPVGNNSVILHVDPLVIECDYEAAYRNMDYYKREFGFHVVNQSKDFGGVSEGPHILTMSK